MSAVYDGIGVGYAAQRRPDPRWERAIHAALGDARSVVNVGDGSGSYEPRASGTVAVEPSSVMIAQRPDDAAPVVRGRAESLPFPDGTFAASLAILTVHHWTDIGRGLGELRRVASRHVIVTWDPDLFAPFWLVRDYLPEWYERESSLATMATIAAAFDDPTIVPLPVPADCTDGFGGAYWRRPEAYLDPRLRASISGLALLDQEVVDAAMARLGIDLETGRWYERNAGILDLDELDLGYRLVVADAG
jgi:hypothetical protein